jgi:3',5'-cyclic AMP phosphodiesterase CpdA
MKLKSLTQGAAICAVLFFIALLTLKTSCNKNIRSGTTIWDSTLNISDSVSFIVIGDWGIMGAQAQRSVAEQMNIYGNKHNVQFIITTGDNFYPVGVRSTTDAHWKASFEDVYNKEKHQVPWYPVLGNHDYGANPQAEIEYSSISNRWKMPARYYTVKKNISASHSAIFAFTDTSPFVTGYYGGGMADLQQQDTAKQLAWLRDVLNTSSDRWKIVIGHHPVYSVGSHGNTFELIQRFKPVFLQTGTDFYICGHDHNLQYILIPNDPVKYLVSGGGGYSSTYGVYPNRNTVFAKSSPGFLIVTLYEDAANFYFYNHLGGLLYRQQIKK